jgi:transposase InsO family protein
MGAKDSSAQLERIFRENVLRPMMNHKNLHNVIFAIEIYRDNLYIAVNDENVLILVINVLAEVCREINLRFGSGKIGVSEIEVLGFEINEKELKPLQRRIQEIQEFPRPMNKKMVRSFLGKCGYYRHLIKDYAILSAGLDEVIGKKDFHWSKAQEESMLNLKKALREEAIVMPYRAGSKVEIFADASQNGVGACLVQDGKVVRWISKKFNKSQRKYSVTRKEALAIMNALREFKHLIDKDTVVWTDHEALIGWFKGCKTDDILLERWGLKLQEYNINLKWRSGEENALADAASRVKEIMAQEIEIISALEGKEVSDDIRRKSRRYTLQDGKLFYKGKTVPDEKGRIDWLKKMHVELGHPSFTKLVNILHTEFDWEDLVKEVREITEECDSCQRGEVGEGMQTRPRNKSAGRSDWNLLDEWSMDLLTDLPVTERGFKHMLVLVEAISRFLEVYFLKNKTAKEVASCLREHIYRYSIPLRLRSDQGGEFTGEEVQELMKEYGIQHKVSSSHYPQGDGQVERMNRDVVDSLTRTATDNEWDLEVQRTAWSIRISPSRRTGLSPYEVLYGVAPRIAWRERINSGHIIEDFNLEELLVKRWKIRKGLEENVRKKLREYENGSTQIRNGDLVWVRNFGRKKFDPRWVGPSVVIERFERSAKIKGESGHQRVVNLGDLKPYKSRREPEGELLKLDGSASAVDGGMPWRIPRVPNESDLWADRIRSW